MRIYRDEILCLETDSAVHVRYITVTVTSAVEGRSIIFSKGSGGKSDFITICNIDEWVMVKEDWNPLNASCTLAHASKSHGIFRRVARATGFVIIVLKTMSALLVPGELQGCP